MCVVVCLYVEPISKSKDYDRFRIKLDSVLCLCRRVCLKCSVYIPLGGILFWRCTSRGVYVPCIYTHARWELPCRRRRSLLLCLFRAPVNSLVCCYCIKINIPLIEITSTMLQPWYSCSKPPDELMTAAPVISYLTFMLTVVSFICRDRSSLPGPNGFHSFNARRKKTGDEGTSTKISVSRRHRKRWNAGK